MIYLIVIVLIVLIGLEYKLQKSYIAPTMLLLLAFLLASGMIAANVTNWEVKIYGRFVLYIFTAIASFAVGCLIIHLLFGMKPNRETEPLSEHQYKVFHGNYPYKLMLFVSLVCTLGYLYLMIRNVGFSGGVSGTLRAIYENITSGNENGFIVNQLNEIMVAVAKISVFQVLVLRYIRKGRCFRLSLFLPVICFMLCMVVSTDRNIFIRFILYCLTLWILFYAVTRAQKKQVKNGRILKKTVIIVVVIALVFYGLGKVKNYTSSIGRMLGIYAGSGLYNFNLYLKDFSGKHLQYGNSTFSSFQNLLKTFGFLGGHPQEIAAHGEFITYRSANGYVYSSNIYSGMRPYADDFGIWGVILFPLILGLIFELLYFLTQKRKYGYTWLLYALLTYAVVYVPIAEQFFKRFHLGMVYEIGWVTVMYLIIYGKRGLWRVRLRS